MKKMLTNLRLWFLRAVTPLQRLMQHLGKPEPRMTKAHVEAILTRARVGDALLSHEDYRLTNSFIRGYFDHAAIVGPNSTVVEAIGKGVQSVDLEEWLYKKDDVCLIRVDVDDAAATTAGTAALQWLRTKYDYLFTFGAEAIYCSELVLMCYQLVRPDFMSAVVNKWSQIQPDDFYDAAAAEQGMRILYRTNKKG